MAQHQQQHRERPSERLNALMTVVMTPRTEDDASPLAAAHQQQQDLAASSASTSDTTIDEGRPDESWPLLRLINETFVSLPISRCIDLVVSKPSTLHQSLEPNNRRLCLIDWTRSKITTWSLTAINDDQNPDQLDQPPNSFSVYQELISNHSERVERTDGALARLVYLSSSSLLSLVGIFTNLLILLIIVVNTKQKCQHFLSRTSHTTSHTNYHYVLLFQLTLTGLLLGGYVLFSTSSQLYMATTTTTTTRIRTFAPEQEQEQQNNNNYLMLSPMSIYLPHTSVARISEPPIRELPAPASWAILGPEDLENSEQSRELDNRIKMIEEPARGESRPARERPVVITPVRCQENSSEPAGASNFKFAEIFLDLVASVHLWTVAALAYDRYCAIAYPLEYLRSINAARAKTFLIILWSGALLTNVLSPLALDKWLRYAASEQLNIATDLPIANSSSSRLKCLLGDERLATTTIAWAVSSLPLGLSCLTFVLVILLPLVCVTICNVSIYGIVKVHERRLSASSGSQSSSGGSGGPGCANLGAMASVASRLRLIEPTLSFYHSNNNKEYSAAADNKSADDTSSLASSILGKLIRSSAQVGSLGGAHVDRRDSDDETPRRSASGSDEDEDLPEIRNLIETAAAAAAPAEDGDSSSTSCRSPGAQQEPDRVSKSASAGGHQAPMNSTIVNRSRRLGSLNKLGRTKSKQPPCQQDDVEAKVAESRIRFLRRSKRKLKRKLSDKEPSLPAGLNRSVSRRGSSSFAPSSWAEQTLLIDSGGGGGNNQQAQDCFCQADNCSLCNAGCNTGVRLLSRNNSRQLDSDGILRQIKMAGLSFAGIAINELMQPPPPGHMRAPARRTTLNRSSSCSLGNLTANSCAVNLTTNNVCCQCDQRQPPVIGGVNKKDSFVSLNMREETPGADQDKYSTRLHSELQPISSQNSASTRSQTAASCQQHFNFGGTKSIAFNVVVWLILILLICSLPQYCLLLISSSRQIYHGQLNVVSLLQDLLQRRLDTTAPQDDVEQPVWLNYTCRLLFLVMLPLNAWLYGIRSRSLKTTLKMVLRRYISKRQASIEINQRRKSNLSMRSRDSSLMSCRTNSRNSSLCCQANQQQQAFQPYNQQYHQQHPRQLGFINGRVFRRCASFNLPPTINQQQVGQQQHPICRHHYHQCLLAQDTEAASTIKQPDQQSQRSHTNSIRFVLGGEDQAPAARASDDPKAPLLPGGANAGPQQCMLSIPGPSVASSQNSISLSSSLASSKRSLLSASILSSHSAAFLLVNNQPNQEECSSLGKAAPGSAHQLLATKPLTGVLKKRDSRSSMMHHQDSYDSACSNMSQLSAGARARAKPTLDRVQSSPSKLLIGVARPRSLVGGKREDDIAQPGSLISSLPSDAKKQRKQMVRQSAHDESPRSVKGGQFCEDEQIESPQHGHINERRPSSDIRLLLTSAEDGDSGEPSHASEGANTTDLLLICDTDCCELSNDERVHSPEAKAGVDEEISPAEFENNNINCQEASRFQLEYYKQIKDAIGKYFTSRKSDRRAGARKDSDDSQFSFVSGQSDGVDQSARDERTTARAHARGAPQRKNSLDSQVVWLHNKTHHHLLSHKHHQHHNHHHHRNLRRYSTTNCGTSMVDGCTPVSTVSGNSLAIKASTSIDSIASDDHNQLAAGRHVAQQNSHLRPPTSLKLLLDPDNQQATLYASSLALSPIKETSSYASSNSSLNNQQQQQQQHSKPQQSVAQ